MTPDVSLGHEMSYVVVGIHAAFVRMRTNLSLIGQSEGGRSLCFQMLARRIRGPQLAIMDSAGLAVEP